MNHIMISQRPVSNGIDVSLEKLDVALLAPDHTTEVRTYDNTTIGITRLLADLKTQRTAKTVPCIIESTGSIHFLVALMVAQAGYAVKCINPLITKKYQRASIRNAKSDRVDAKRLAEIGFLEPDLRLYKGSEETLLISKLIGSLAKCEKVQSSKATADEYCPHRCNPRCDELRYCDHST